LYLRLSKQTLQNIKNNLICNVILRTLNFRKIYASMGTTNIILINKLYSPKVTLLSDGLVVTASHDGELRLFDVNNYKYIKTLAKLDQFQT
jgi:hypothetical protein